MMQNKKTDIIQKAPGMCKEHGMTRSCKALKVPQHTPQPQWSSQTECAQHVNDTKRSIATRPMNTNFRRTRVSPAPSRVYFHSMGSSTKRGEDSNKLPFIAPPKAHIAENRQSRWYRVKRSSRGRDGHKAEGQTR